MLRGALFICVYLYVYIKLSYGAACWEMEPGPPVLLRKHKKSKRFLPPIVQVSVSVGCPPVTLSYAVHFL